MSVRNFSVARGVIESGGATVAYSVPAESVLILKNIQVFFAGGASPSCLVYIAVQAGTPSVLLANLIADSHGIAAWNGWTVLNGNDYVYVVASGSSLQYWIAGAVLDTTATNP